MAKVMVAHYRYIEQPKDEDYAVRHVLRPGDDPKELPKEVRQDLEKRKLIMDERRFDADQNVVLPAEEALRRIEAAEASEKKPEKPEASTDDETEANPSSSDQTQRPSRAAAAKRAVDESKKGSGKSESESKSDEK